MASRRTVPHSEPTVDSDGLPSYSSAESGLDGYMPDKTTLKIESIPIKCTFLATSPTQPRWLRLAGGRPASAIPEIGGGKARWGTWGPGRRSRESRQPRGPSRHRRRRHGPGPPVPEGTTMGSCGPHGVAGSPVPIHPPTRSSEEGLEGGWNGGPGGAGIRSAVRPPRARGGGGVGRGEAHPCEETGGGGHGVQSTHEHQAMGSLCPFVVFGGMWLVPFRRRLTRRHPPAALGAGADGGPGDENTMAAGGGGGKKKPPGFGGGGCTVRMAVRRGPHHPTSVRRIDTGEPPARQWDRGSGHPGAAWNPGASLAQPLPKAPLAMKRHQSPSTFVK